MARWLAVYLIGSRVLAGGGREHSGPLLRAALIGVTVCLALLRPAISTTGVVLVTAAWACRLGRRSRSQPPYKSGLRSAR